MSSDYSKSSLLKFLDTSVAKGMVNANTGAGLKAACVKILDDVADDADVRGIEVNTAVIRYNNRHPNVLAPNSLAQYQRRVSRAISDFVRWVENPAAFKMRNRGTPERNGKTGGNAPKKLAAVRAQDASSAQVIPAMSASAGLPMSFPLRSDFLAQVVIPRDLTAEEARRLGAFLLTLAVDFRPTGSGEMK